jgi:hypothetical protein
MGLHWRARAGASGTFLLVAKTSQAKTSGKTNVGRPFLPARAREERVGWSTRPCHLVPQRSRREEVLPNAAKTRQRNVFSRLRKFAGQVFFGGLSVAALGFDQVFSLRCPLRQVFRGQLSDRPFGPLRAVAAQGIAGKNSGQPNSPAALLA